MRGEWCWLLALGGFAAVSLLCGLWVWPQLAAVWPSIQDRIDQFRRLPPLAKVMLLLFVGVFVVYGSTKTNGVDQAGVTNGVEIVDGGTNEVELVGGGTNGADGIELDMNEIASCGGAGRAALPSCVSILPYPVSCLASSAPRLAALGGEGQLQVTEDDIARGWRVWEVRTNAAVDYAMPAGAVMATNWWVRGAYEDCSIVRLGDCSDCSIVRLGDCSDCSIDSHGLQSINRSIDQSNNRTMSFPFGTNEYDSAWAFSWGKLRFALGDAASEIVAVGAPMAAVPRWSRLWTAVGTNGAWLVTWENFALGRDTNAPVNAQVELRTTGDFVTRSNEVETVCRRVDPEDWDGDGWQNDDDPDPCNADEFYEDFSQSGSSTHMRIADLKSLPKAM